MDIVMQRMTIANMEADMDRLIKVGIALEIKLLTTFFGINCEGQYFTLLPVWGCCFAESEARRADSPAGIAVTQKGGSDGRWGGA